MPYFSCSGWPMQPGPFRTSADSLPRFLEALSLYRHRPFGLLSHELWEEPGYEAEEGAQRQLPDWIARPDLFPRPGLRNLVYDRDYDGPPRPPSAIELPPSGVREPDLFRSQRHKQAVGDGGDTAFPDAVVNSFRGPLDTAGLRFLKHGPLSIGEQLAFAQRVHPDAYRSASSAPEAERSRFRRARTLDQGRYFVGPDHNLYLRGGDTEEPLAYRLRGDLRTPLVDLNGQSYLGTHPKRAVIAGKAPGYVDSGREQAKTDLLNMKDGDTLHRGSHWDAQLPYPKWTRFPFEATVGTPSADANLYGATGDAMLRSDGGFTFHRMGNRIEFKGAVEHNFDERFEFELDGRLPFYAPAKGSIIPWEITQEEGVAMQNSGLGKPFQTSARWDQRVSGVLTIDSKGELRLDHIEWGEATPRRPQRGR